MADIETIGIDRADFGNALILLAGRAETLGTEQHPVFLDQKLDIAAQGLRRNRVERIIAAGIVLRRGRWRGQIVD